MQQLAAFALLALTPLFLAPPTGHAPANMKLQVVFAEISAECTP